MEGTHIRHCCKWHGCKYGNTSCPVTTERKEQAYPCEVCSFAREEMERMLHDFFDFDMDSVSRRAFYDGLKARGLKVVKIDD